MDALHPRLLVSPSRFAETFRFYAAALPKLIGAHLVNGTEDGPYANWDCGEQGVLILFDRGAMAATIGTADLPATPGPAQDTTMLVCRVDAVDEALALCLEHGATLVAEAMDRPQWGPTLRTAHVRDPDGNLIEIQSY